MKRLSSFVLTLVAVVALTAGSAVAATVANGGFESGTLAGWTVVNEAGGSGNWFNYSGTSSPLSGSTIPAPPQGTHAAITDQTGPGSHILLQNIALEAGMKHSLSFDLYYNNQAGVFFSPDSLSYNVFPNQQYRVDLLRQGAPPDSVAPGDVLATLFQTRPGDPVSLAPTVKTFDLTRFAGSTVRLRFAEVDNQSNFQAGVDAVAVVSKPATPTSKDQCKKGGWRTLADDHGRPFKNQGDCVSFVVAHRH